MNTLTAADLLQERSRMLELLSFAQNRILKLDLALQSMVEARRFNDANANSMSLEELVEYGLDRAGVTADLTKPVGGDRSDNLSVTNMIRTVLPSLPDQPVPPGYILRLVLQKYPAQTKRIKKEVYRACLRLHELGEIVKTEEGILRGTGERSVFAT